MSSMKKILIVEDDADARMGYHVLFAAHGYQSAFAVDSVSAISETRKHSPDLVILDLGLPAGDGFVVLDRLRANADLSLIPVVVVSGRAAQENRDRALGAGAKAFVQKPWNDDDLLTLIGELVADSGPVGVSLDVTEQRLVEERNQQSHNMEAIGRHTSGVAHDFNNLLTVILGFADSMASQESIDAPSEDLSEIIKAARSAAGLTKQLLAYSRPQSLHPIALDVNSLIREMTGMVGKVSGEHITVSLNLSPDLHPVLADKGQIERVVMNLVVNAKDAMPDGGVLTLVTSNVELEHSSFHDRPMRKGHYVVLAVTDTGAGMTRETQRRLFEPFYTTKDEGKGTGLGLSTTSDIVEQSKGYIWVCSEPGLGTTFTLYLPSAATDVAAATWRHAETPVPPCDSCGRS